MHKDIKNHLEIKFFESERWPTDEEWLEVPYEDPQPDEYYEALNRGASCRELDEILKNSTT